MDGRKWSVTVAFGWFPAIEREVVGTYSSRHWAEFIAFLYQVINPFAWVTVEETS